jgi:aminopeptidase N
MVMTVLVPEAWKAISNEYAANVQTVAGEECPDNDPIFNTRDKTKTWNLYTFNKTRRISTYLYAVCAGPYHEVKKDENSSGIPLGLYCRKTLAAHLDREAEHYFNWTIRGFEFYTNFFGVPYPYTKYDQLFVPEFKFGAMENVGCVTYRDQYVFKEKVSKTFFAGVCHTFLHEMAHMWFGNLVTMKWWNDLWLNESFADWCSY